MTNQGLSADDAEAAQYKLSRGLQRQILIALADAEPVGTYDLADAIGKPDIDRNTLITNALYLQGHGLIQCGFQESIAIGVMGRYVENISRITPRGQDFLLDDGGLSAVLGVVTIKIHEDSVRALLLAKVEESDLAPEQRSALVEAIRSLPAAAARTAIDKLIGLGVQHLPSGFHELHTWLTQAGQSLRALTS